MTLKNKQCQAVLLIYDIYQTFLATKQYQQQQLRHSLQWPTYCNNYIVGNFAFGPEKKKSCWSISCVCILQSQKFRHLTWKLQGQGYLSASPLKPLHILHTVVVMQCCKGYTAGRNVWCGTGWSPGVHLCSHAPSPMCWWHHTVDR